MGKDTKVLSFINMKGGVGKTTLTVNLSDCLNRSFGKKVLTLDVDPLFSATRYIFSEKRRAEYGQNCDTMTAVFDREKHGAGSPKDLRDIVPQKVREGWDALPTTLSLYEVELRLGRWKEFRLKEYVDVVLSSEKYDYIILDTPPTPSLWMTSALIVSDFYVVPVKPEPLSMANLELTEEVIQACKKNYNLDIQCLGYVTNLFDKRSTLREESLSLFENNPRFSEKIFINGMPQRTKIARHPLKNKFILDVGDKVAKDAIKKISSELLFRIERKQMPVDIKAAT